MTLEKPDLTGETAFITGTTRGIGKAIALALAEQAIDYFGDVNIVINNASAIQLATIENLPSNRFDLLTEVNARGTYLVTRAFLDHLQETTKDAWILTNAPPVKIDRAPP